MAETPAADPSLATKLIVAFTVVGSMALNFTGHLDSMAYWKTVSLVVGSLVLGSPIAGMASIWTAAKAQEMVARMKS